MSDEHDLARLLAFLTRNAEGDLAAGSGVDRTSKGLVVKGDRDGHAGQDRRGQGRNRNPEWGDGNAHGDSVSP
jgi:hypothetical protein